MLRLLCFISLLGGLHLPQQTSREEVRYDLLVRGKVVGELLAVREMKEGREHFSNLTDVNVNFLRSFNVKFDQEAVFAEGILLRANSRTFVNGSLHSEIIVSRSGSAYELSLNGEKKLVPEKITYASTMLMLREPKNVRQTFSEQDGKFHPIISQGNGRYLKENPKGSPNEYRYRDGKLVYAKVHSGWLSFELQLKNT